MNATLMSKVNKTTNLRDWFVLTDHADATDYGPVRCFIPPQGGESSLKTCETWLENRGFTRKGDLPPDIFEYETGELAFTNLPRDARPRTAAESERLRKQNNELGPIS
jgi:hypothetical protein